MHFMKRLLILVVAIAALALPVFAQSAPDLTALAPYFPETTPLYASFRTDGAVIDDLEAVRAHIADALPDFMIGDETFAEMLDGLGPLTGSGDTFAEAVQPWLGASAAVGPLSLEQLMNNENDAAFLIALQITDRAQAQAFFASGMGSSANVEETDTYTLLTPSSPSADPAGIYIDDSVLLLTNKPEVLPVNGMISPSLADNAGFQEAWTSLPADAYAVFTYMDYAAFMQASVDQMIAASPRDAAQFEALLPLVGTFKDLGLGMTLLDGRSLTMDVNLSWDAEGMMGMVPASPSPYDPAFAEYLPAGTALAVQGANLAAYWDQMLANLSTLGEVQQGADGANAAEMIAGLEFAIQGVTGLDLQDDVLSWMTGQYAIGMSLDLPTLTDARNAEDALPRALQFAFVVENTTGEGAQALVAGVSSWLTQFAEATPSEEMTVTEETIGGAPALVISIESRGMLEPFQIVIGGDENVFVIGTPAMAQAALAPDGSLSSDAGYQDAVAVALDGAVQLVYANGDFLNRLIELSLFGRPANRSELAVGPLFSSLSISDTVGEENVTARLVMTLAE